MSAPTTIPALAAEPPGTDAAEAIARIPGRWAVFLVVLIADVMDLVDSSVTNVAGPSIRASLNGGDSMLQWLGAGYTLTFAVFLITGARLGDLYGRRRLFLIGAAGFTIISALCAIAWSPESLIGLRVLQGAFGALMIPQGFGMLKELFREDEMAKVFGFFGPAMGLSAILGPILGALLIQADLFGTGWRMIFLVNVPFGLFAFFGALKWMPKTVMSPGGGLDFGGMVIVGTAAFLLIFPLIEGREYGWPWWTFAMFAAGALLSVLFVSYERRRPAESALIEASLLKNMQFNNGIFVAVGFFAAVAGISLVLSLFWQIGEQRDALQTALALAPMSIGMVVGMVSSFALVDRLGRKLVQVGTLITAAGLVLMAFSVHGTIHPSAWSLVPAMVLIGIGMGQVFGQLFEVTLSSVDDVEVGSASGVLNATQQLSFSLGVAAVGTVFFHLLDGQLASNALSTTVLFTLIPLAISFVLAFRLPPKARVEAAH